MIVPFRRLMLTSVSASVLGLSLVAPSHSDERIVDTPETGTVYIDGVPYDILIITEDGSITTTLDDEHGVESSVDRGVVINNGTITTSGLAAHGIYNTGANATITNNGLILTTGSGSTDGIRNEGDDAVITNNGKILAENFGIENFGGRDAVITNSGVIRTNSAGIYNDGSGSSGTSIINTGSITAGTGIINYEARDVLIINNGEIHTISKGIFSERSANSVFVNSGVIQSGTGGIFDSDSRNATIINSGRINTSGADAHAIYHESFSTTFSKIINSGSLWTSGANAAGIFVEIDNFSGAGKSMWITSNGSIISERSDALFVGVGFDDIVINLNAPGYLGGAVTLGSSTTLNINTGASHSVLWQLPTTNVDGAAANVSGSVPWFYDEASGQFATFDPTGLTASFNQMADTANTLARLGRYGLGRAQPGTGGSGSADALLAHDENGDLDDRFDALLATNSGPEAAYGPASGRFWITGFGGYVNYDGDEATLNQRIDQIGAALGYAWQQSPDARLSVMAGYMNGQITAESPWADAQDIDSNGVFAGIYGDRRFGPVTLGLGVAGGWQTNDSTRFVNDNTALTDGLTLGESSATSSYDSWFVTPEATLSADIGLGPTGLILTPTVRGRYALQRTGGYTESGSNANATVDAHTLGVVEGDFELALSRRFQLLTLTGRAGYLLRNATGNDDVPVTLLGITNSVGLGATDRSVAYLGAALDLDLGPQASFTLDGQGYLSDDIDGLEGMARLAIRF